MCSHNGCCTTCGAGITSPDRFRYQVPESTTEDDVAEEPVKSPKACGKLWIDWCPYILGIVGVKTAKCLAILTLEDLRDSGYRMRGGALLVTLQWNGLAICQL